MKINRVILVLLTWAFASAIGCSDTAPAPESKSDRVIVAVSIAPLMSLIVPMLPVGSEVAVVLPPRTTPHAEELTPSRVQLAAEADVLVYIGGGADPVVERIARAREKRGLLNVALDDQMHDHGEHEHAHADAHPWLHPAVVRDAMPRIAQAVQTALERKQISASAEQINRGVAVALRDIDEVDRTYRAVLSSMSGARFVSLHGAFDALLMEYGLERVAVIQTGHGVEPGVGAMAAAMQAAADDPSVLIIVESTVAGAPAERLAAETGARIVRLDPTGDGDWESMMRGNLRAILTAP